MLPSPSNSISPSPLAPASTCLSADLLPALLGKVQASSTRVGVWGGAVYTVVFTSCSSVSIGSSLHLPPDPLEETWSFTTDWSRAHGYSHRSQRGGCGTSLYPIGPIANKAITIFCSDPSETPPQHIPRPLQGCPHFPSQTSLLTAVELCGPPKESQKSV